LRFRILGFQSGFRVQGSGFRNQGILGFQSGFRVQGLGFRNQGILGFQSGFRVQGLGFRNQGILGFQSGLKVQGLELRIQGFQPDFHRSGILPTASTLCWISSTPSHPLPWGHTAIKGLGFMVQGIPPHPS
jgi:hypothetical protein